MALYLSRVTFKPSNLEDWQIADAKRLKKLYEAKFPKGSKGMSQQEFGVRFSIGTQGQVWQYLNAKRPLNTRAAAAFAEGLGVAIADISPKLAAQLDAMNSNPRLRELLEECVTLDDEQLKTATRLIAALRKEPSSNSTE
jgi:transcriptional regulator with XRE-family HTH domain